MNVEQSFVLFMVVMAGIGLAVTINWLINVLSGED